MALLLVEANKQHCKTILGCTEQPLPQERSISLKISLVLRFRKPGLDQSKSSPGAGVGDTFLEAHGQGGAEISV